MPWSRHARSETCHGTRVPLSDSRILNHTSPIAHSPLSHGGQFQQFIVGMEQAIKPAAERTHRQHVGVMPAQVRYQGEP